MKPGIIGIGLFAMSWGLVGCSENASGKHWSALMACTLGKAASAAPAERTQQLRLIQLSHPGTDGKADAWPGRCATYANQLYASLESSGNQASLKRSLQSKLGCSEGKPSCVLNSDTVALLTGELSEGAKAAELKLEPTNGVKEPEISVDLTLTAAQWQPIKPGPSQLVGPEQTSSGDVHWLLKSPGERMRPVGCVFSAASSSLDCIAGNEKMPALPPQSIQLVSDDKDLYAAGLTEQGLTGYQLKTGEATPVKGQTGNLVHEGVAVERGEGDKGYVAIPLSKGKAGKPIAIKSKGNITQPMTSGNQVLWLEPAEGGNRLVVRTLKGNQLADTAALTGAFNGPFHLCRSGHMTALATWAGHTGQRAAKPTAGSDMTQLTFSMATDGAWSKAIEAKLPFKRVIESDLVCSQQAATVAWVEPVEGGVRVGQLTCDANGCKTADAQLQNIESRWWWAVGPVGDKMLVMWRANLGEARMRLAPLAQLNQAKDVVLFDDPDHGGPKAGEAVTVYGPSAALLLFKQEPPSALTIGIDGSAKSLSAK
jgi:hypothetical protein